MPRLGKLYIVAAPSGAGKTSLVNALINEIDAMQLSISYTTRLKRDGEVEGKDYFFVSKDEFKKMVEQHKFLEHAAVFGNLYGTSEAWVESTLAKGIDVILEIDWQGAAQIRKLIPGTVNIFVLPPSKKALEGRLRNRGKDNGNTIAVRLSQSTREISHYTEYDYLIVNDDFAKALNDLKTIVQCHRLELAAQEEKHAELLKELLGEE